MHLIHGTNIYAGFVPMFAVDRQGWNSERSSVSRQCRRRARRAAKTIGPLMLTDQLVARGVILTRMGFGPGALTSVGRFALAVGRDDLGWFGDAAADRLRASGLHLGPYPDEQSPRIGHSVAVRITTRDVGFRIELLEYGIKSQIAQRLQQAEFFRPKRPSV